MHGMANATITRLGATVIAVDPFVFGYDDNDGTSNLYKKLSIKYNLKNDQFSKLWSDAMTYDIVTRKSLCNYALINGYSTEASKHFKGESIDFLFIDGLHTYEGVMADCNAWWPKVRNGGTIMFNDYGCRRPNKCAFPGVTKAADECLAAHGLEIEPRHNVMGNAWVVKK